MIQGSAPCTSFKRELFLKIHDCLNDVLMIALYSGDAELGRDTTFYITEGEIEGTGYITGGQRLLSPQVLADAATGAVFMTFADPLWLNSYLTARAALIYNQSAGQRAIGVMDFGEDLTSNNGEFRVQFPPPDPARAVIRIA
jgi:hypothetical protein